MFLVSGKKKHLDSWRREEQGEGGTCHLFFSCPFVHLDVFWGFTRIDRLCVGKVTMFYWTGQSHLGAELRDGASRIKKEKKKKKKKKERATSNRFRLFFHDFFSSYLRQALGKTRQYPHVFGSRNFTDVGGGGVGERFGIKKMIRNE